jgi:DNA repair protein RecO (recombination protein O)
MGDLIFNRTEGIVLRWTDFSNTSKIVTIYTRDHGKLRVLAKGAKRKKSEFLGILEPFCLLEVVYIEKKRGMHLLKEACLLDSNPGIRQELTRIAYGMQLLSLVEQSQPEEDPDPVVFELLSSSLRELQRATSPENVSILFQLRLLRHFGKLPSLTNCIRCDSMLGPTTFYSARSEGFLCEACGEDRRFSVPQGTLRALRRLAESPSERAGRIGLLKEQRGQIAQLLSTMWKAVIEAELPAEKVTDSLLR